MGYDWHGNLTTDPMVGITNSWTYKNELATTRIMAPGSRKSVSCGYDSGGQQISLIETAAGGITRTVFPTQSYSEIILPNGTIERTVSIEVAGLLVATVERANRVLQVFFDCYLSTSLYL